ncbi:MAG: glucuronyl esterase domain-containing protein, partial [Bryobacteraceae bacterium]
TEAPWASLLAAGRKAARWAVGMGVLAGVFPWFVLPALGQGPAAQDTREWATTDDHNDMMRQLGIRALRPGRNANEKAPDAANYDESRANPFPDYPELLRLKDGRAVTSPEMWWKLRRPEIVEDFEREVYGRVPANAPRIEWRVVRRAEDKAGPFPVLARELRGRADNSACPQIEVEIQMVVVTPAWVKQPVPLMILFGRPALPSDPVPAALAKFAALAGPDPPATVQLIGAGWGYALLSPATIQADNGARLTKGIIGLANCGWPRKPEDWGALRAWAWGASRAFDFLETDPSVDSRRVGIEGVSRYGKAALVTMAFDTRFAVALVGSSGEGGVKPHRQNFGEAVENLTGPGEYHWMAGSFLKYGAAEADFGSKNADNIPVDAHQLLALCASKRVFVRYGIPEKGDAKWLDQQGSFMATVAAGPAWRLLGARDLGVEEDYRKAKMPPVNTGLLEGELAWRQHDGGHTDGPNWKYFIPWASKKLGWSVPPPPNLPPGEAVPRLDANSLTAHAQLLEKARQGRIELYFLGDSITRRWGTLDYPQFLEHWKKTFFGWNAANFGWGGDTTRNILWRVRNGEMDGVNPKVVVLMAGTNNLGRDAATDIAAGVEAVIRAVQEKAPQAVVILISVLPRCDRPGLLEEAREVNRRLARLEEERVRFVDLTDRLAGAAGKPLPGRMDKDGIHLAAGGYEAWAQALRPHVIELLGPPAAKAQALTAAPPLGNRPDPSGWGGPTSGFLRKKHSGRIVS